jgi:hypothetical protein
VYASSISTVSTMPTELGARAADIASADVFLPRPFRVILASCADSGDAPCVGPWPPTSFGMERCSEPTCAVRRARRVVLLVGKSAGIPVAGEPLHDRSGSGQPRMLPDPR